jgi:hypothetical protein
LQVASKGNPNNGAVNTKDGAVPPAAGQERVPNSNIDYIPAPTPGDDAERLRLLRSMNILDTEQEDRFSNITKLVCSVFNIPIAAVSLVDSDKSITGSTFIPTVPASVTF